jgi:VCBS repeat-containing protein
MDEDLGIDTLVPVDAQINTEHRSAARTGDPMANLVGTGSSDTLIGGNSKDVIIALEDDDIVDGGGGSDWISGDAGNDWLFGGRGNDILIGGMGADLIHGGAGNDSIGLDDDSRNAGGGGLGGDLIYGDGYNTFALVPGGVVGQDPTVATQLGDDLIHGTVDADVIYGDNGDNADGLNVGGADSIFAGSGEDVVYGEGGNDSLSGEGGRDQLTGGDGKDTLRGGDSADVLSGGRGADVIDGGPGDDRIVYASIADSSGGKVDTVIDFSHGLNYSSGDKLDITALAGPGSDIHWTGAVAQSGAAWYEPVAGGVRLMVDVNGDAAADLEVFLAQTPFDLPFIRHSDVLGVVNADCVAVDDADSTIVEEGATAGNAQAFGSVTANDNDLDTDYLLVTNPGMFAGIYGSLVLTEWDGQWTYTLDNADLQTEQLAQGESVSEQFSYTISDGLTTSSATLVINITGANDAAIVSGDVTGAVIEGQTRNHFSPPAFPDSGQLYATDVDGPDNVFQAVAAGTPSFLGYGTYEVTSDGFWTYTLDDQNPTVQALTGGQFAADAFTVHTADGTAQQVTVTIQGTDDAPTLTGPLGTQHALEETPFVFSVANGTAISLSDPDSTSGTVTLSGGIWGKFTLAHKQDLTFTTGDGTDDPVMVFSGTIAALNAALEEMSVITPTNMNGPAVMGVSAGGSALNLFFTVHPVNDAPSGSSIPASTSEGAVLVFAPAANEPVVIGPNGAPQFIFSDPQDASFSSPALMGSNAFSGLVVTTLPTAGTLTNHGVAVAPGDFVSKDDLIQGQFHFVPDAGGFGTDYASFEFQVKDDGGTANGGVDLDPTPTTLVISVTPAVFHGNGTPGDDTLNGSNLNDILVGGPGSDTLNGSFGADIFRWAAGDEGAPAPTDIVNGFSPTIAPQTDALDLRDLLVGETASTLGDYLDFSFGGGNTTIDVRSGGALGPVDQKIVLTGVDLTSLGSEGDIIGKLLTSGKLITD